MGMVAQGFERFYDGELNAFTIDNDKANLEGVENLNKLLGI